MSNGELGNKDLSFGINVLETRRKYMLMGIFEKDVPENLRIL